MNPLRTLMRSYQNEGYKVSLVPDYEDQKSYRIDLRHVTEWSEIEQKLSEIWSAMEQTDAPKPKGKIELKDALNFVKTKGLLVEEKPEWTKEESGGSSAPQVQEKQRSPVLRSRQRQMSMDLKI